MKSWKRVPWIAACSLVIPLVFVMLYPAAFASVVCALWSVAAMSISVYAMKRQAEAERKTIIQSMERTAIASLNHHRHDWMNDLQVLYGYLRLGKLDKSLQCVERIKERVTEESRISKLGIPSLVFYLQSFRASGVALDLHVQVEEELQLSALVSPEDGESLTGGDCGCNSGLSIWRWPVVLGRGAQTDLELRAGSWRCRRQAGRGSNS
ncbi:Spo0B domain-containing protein [Paenibacillus amylolyticus]|uniref:Spo0B domain-containing protein n=1 Tax=Paenibacillus amylolyticus TaxID=1451 RepID=UPI003EB7115D